MRSCIVAFACRTVALALAGSVGWAAWTSLPATSRGLAHGSTPGAIISGTARVIDGDTIEIGGRRIRLHGIDAPETGQTCLDHQGEPWNCGNVAAAELEKTVRHQTVNCDDRGLDKYGRTLAVCFVAGLDLNAEMVRRGLAWAFVRYAQTYVGQEAEARQAAVGIWSGASTPAWTWREQQWTASVNEAPAGCAIKGNVGRNGAIYHMPWSPWYAKVKMDGTSNKRWFCNEADAVAAGFRPALWR